MPSAGFLSGAADFMTRLGWSVPHTLLALLVIVAASALAWSGHREPAFVVAALGSVLLAIVVTRRSCKVLLGDLDIVRGQIHHATLDVANEELRVSLRLYSPHPVNRILRSKGNDPRTGEVQGIRAIVAIPSVLAGDKDAPMASTVRSVELPGRGEFANDIHFTLDLKKRTLHPKTGQCIGGVWHYSPWSEIHLTPLLADRENQTFYGFVRVLESQTSAAP